MSDKNRIKAEWNSGTHTLNKALRVRLEKRLFENHKREFYEILNIM